jgi:hypothetical protein
MIELLLPYGFDTLEYSWVKATIGIHTLVDYSVAKKLQQYVALVTPVRELKSIINDLLDYCSHCKCLSGSGKRLPHILSWVCQEVSRDTIPSG